MSAVCLMLEQDVDTLTLFNLCDCAAADALALADEPTAHRCRQLADRQVELLRRRYYCQPWEIMEAAGRLAEGMGLHTGDDDLQDNEIPLDLTCSLSGQTDIDETFAAPAF
jgi:hypothetical protein